MYNCIRRFKFRSGWFSARSSANRIRGNAGKMVIQTDDGLARGRHMIKTQTAELNADRVDWLSRTIIDRLSFFRKLFILCFFRGW